MLIRVPCECGKSFLAGEEEAGKTLSCPGCGRALVVPPPPPPPPPEGPVRVRDSRFWQQQGELQPDPTSETEREYQRSRRPKERARRARARQPWRVRLRGGLQMAAAVALVVPAYYLVAALDVPLRRARAAPVLLVFVLFMKGWIELATGKPAGDTLHLASRPADWREFRAFAFLVVSFFAMAALFLGLVFLVEKSLKAAGMALP
jgi:hypothetical protein